LRDRHVFGILGKPFQPTLLPASALSGMEYELK
jgi:hypothetical protein